MFIFFFFSSRRRHTRYWRDWSSDVCSSDLPGGHWKRLTILGAIARDGLVAVMTVAAATSTAVFLAFLEQVLIPALRTRPEVLVAMDNLAPHRAAVVRNALSRA